MSSGRWQPSFGDLDVFQRPDHRHAIVAFDGFWIDVDGARTMYCKVRFPVGVDLCDALMETLQGRLTQLYRFRAPPATLEAAWHLRPVTDDFVLVRYDTHFADDEYFDPMAGWFETCNDVRCVAVSLDEPCPCCEGSRSGVQVLDEKELRAEAERAGVCLLDLNEVMVELEERGEPLPHTQWQLEMMEGDYDTETDTSDAD